MIEARITRDDKSVTMTLIHDGRRAHRTYRFAEILIEGASPLTAFHALAWEVGLRDKRVLAAALEQLLMQIPTSVGG